MPTFRADVNTLLFVFYCMSICLFWRKKKYLFCYTFVLRSKWDLSGTCQIRERLKLLCPSLYGLPLEKPSLLWLAKSCVLNHVLKIACRPAGNFCAKCCSLLVDVVSWCLMNSPWWMCPYRTDEKVGRPHLVLTSERYMWWWCLSYLI